MVAWTTALDDVSLPQGGAWWGECHLLSLFNISKYGLGRAQSLSNGKPDGDHPGREQEGKNERPPRAVTGKRGRLAYWLFGAIACRNSRHRADDDLLPGARLEEALHCSFGHAPQTPGSTSHCSEHHPAQLISYSHFTPTLPVNPAAFHFIPARNPPDHGIWQRDPVFPQRKGRREEHPDCELRAQNAAVLGHD